MAWNLKDEDLLTQITSTTAPPSAASDLLGSDLWANAFSMWATDHGFEGGDYQASHLFDLWNNLKYGASGEEIYARYVEPSSPSALPFPSSVGERFERVANGMEDDYSGVLGEVQAAATEMLDPYISAFRADIDELQSTRGSDPQLVATTRDRIDMSVVDAVNQAALKSLPEAEGIDSFVDFVQYGDVVLIGDGHAPSYYDYVNSKGGSRGSIYMNKKGGLLGAGELLVGLASNLPIPADVAGNAQDAVTEAIGRISKKKVKFK